jgi:alkyldihydroxyacetonephosphate synthase
MFSIQSVIRGNVHLGSIHIAAGRPQMLECVSSSDYVPIANEIQLQQKERLCISDYHIDAMASLLLLEPSSIRNAMVKLGCRFWPVQKTGDKQKQPRFSENPSELCTIMLQASHHISKALRQTDPDWSRWLDRTALGSGQNLWENKDFSGDESVRLLCEALRKMFAEADSRVGKALCKLSKSGFRRPQLEHVLQTACAEEADVVVPGVLICAAASLLLSGQASTEPEDKLDKNCLPEKQLSLTSKPPQVLQESQERLGFWGFHDSGFTLQVDKKGAPYVSMVGDRYSLAGKALSKLLPFVETETHIEIDPCKEAFQDSRRRFDEFQASLEVALDEEDIVMLQSTVALVSLSAADRARHGTCHCQQDIYAIRSGLTPTFRVPDAVAWPTTEPEVMELICLAKKQGWCLIPYGGGTNVTQATRCPLKEFEPRPILSVDMTKMNRILWLNEEDGVACVEAGINGRDLVAALEKRGYTMGHEPDSIEFSTLGGWVATKASGMKRNKYGNIEDIVKAVRVAGSEGMIWQQDNDEQGGKSSVFGRESTGMDFGSLLLGSEGCLGIVTSAVIRVWPLPEEKEYDSVLLSNFETGLRFVRDIAKLDRLVPASVRLLDNEHFRLGQALQADASSAKDHILRLLRKVVSAWVTDSLEARSVVCTTICYEGSRAEVRQQKAVIRKLANQHGGLLLGQNIGKAGYDMTFMIAYLRDFAMTYNLLGESFETFAPWSKVQSVIHSTKNRIQQEHKARCLPGAPFIGCRVTQLYHEGACLYFYFCMSTENVNNASQVFSEIEHAARSEIRKQGGSIR